MLRQFGMFAAVCFAVLNRGGIADDRPAAAHRRGALVLCGGALAASWGNPQGQLPKDGAPRNSISKRFTELAGGPAANYVIVHVPHSRAPKDERPLADRVMSAPDVQTARGFGVSKMTALGFTGRDAADSKEFVAPLREANGAWITGGDLNILLREGKDTLLQRELKAILDRGGAIGGDSAGALIMTSQIAKNIKGAPPGVEPDTTLNEGFGFLNDVVVVPHVLRMSWQENLVPVIAAHPKLLGLGIDEGAAIVVQDRFFEVLGSSKVLVYDNQVHQGKRYYSLSAGDRFDLVERKPATKPQPAR